MKRGIILLSIISVLILALTLIFTSEDSKAKSKDILMKHQQVVIDSLNIQIMQKDSLIKDQAALIENYQLLYELGE